MFFKRLQNGKSCAALRAAVFLLCCAAALGVLSAGLHHHGDGQAASSCWLCVFASTLVIVVFILAPIWSESIPSPAVPISFVTVKRHFAPSQYLRGPPA